MVRESSTERTEREGRPPPRLISKYSLELVVPSKTFRLGQVLFRVKYSFNLFMPKKEKKIILCRNQTRLLGEHVSQTKSNQIKTFSYGVKVHDDFKWRYIRCIPWQSFSGRSWAERNKNTKQFLWLIIWYPFVESSNYSRKAKKGQHMTQPNRERVFCLVPYQHCCQIKQYKWRKSTKNILQN